MTAAWRECGRRGPRSRRRNRGPSDFGLVAIWRRRGEEGSEGGGDIGWRFTQPCAPKACEPWSRIVANPPSPSPSLSRSLLYRVVLALSLLYRVFLALSLISRPSRSLSLVSRLSRSLSCIASFSLSLSLLPALSLSLVSRLWSRKLYSNSMECGAGDGKGRGGGGGGIC